MRISKRTGASIHSTFSWLFAKRNTDGTHSIAGPLTSIIACGLTASTADAWFVSCRPRAPGSRLANQSKRSRSTLAYNLYGMADSDEEGSEAGYAINAIRAERWSSEANCMTFLVEWEGYAMHQ